MNKRVFRHYWLLLLSSCLLSGSLRAQTGYATLINADPSQEVFLYYFNSLLEQTTLSLKPKEILRIRLDSTLFSPLSVFVPYSNVHIGMAVLMLPGDTISIKHNTQAQTYDFTGNHPTELAFFKKQGMTKLTLVTISPLVTYGKKMPFDYFLQNWRQVQQESEKDITALKTTIGVRNAIADCFAAGLRLQIFAALLAPLRDSPPREFPPVYQETVRNYSKLLQNKQSLASINSEKFVYGLRNYLWFLVAAQGRKADHRTLYELASREYVGFQREWTQYFIIKDGQEEHEDMRELVKDFQSRVSADNPFLKKLLAAEHFNAYPILQDASLNDTLTNLLGQSVGLLDLVARNKGKVIYLDLWASWCAPCLMQMPASDTLQQAYEGKPLLVAYLSVDEKVDKWQQASQQYLPSTSHSYRLVDEFKSGLVKTFKVQSIPRYLLIDKEGIVRYAHAPKPSDPKLREIINQLLL